MTVCLKRIIVGVCLLNYGLNDIITQKECSRTELSYYSQSDNKCLHCKICNDDANRNGGDDCNLGIYRCKKNHSFLPVCPAVKTSLGEICSAEVAETCNVLCTDGSKATLKCTVVNHNSRNTIYTVVDGNRNCSWILYRDKKQRPRNTNNFFNGSENKQLIHSAINKTAKSVIKDTATTLQSHKSFDAKSYTDEDLREPVLIVTDVPAVNRTINLQDDGEHQSPEEDWDIVAYPRCENSL
ncbi:DgyrCDS11065 [Dimorphilus gyrociliatus]|uniref:DgyrCDS11065 n=1 Tax=Dimorphilus gyrociliatus TaxID=2664684 RepID=A0A7I8W391_9ANNE|nr:DgyrCDS11065 [Dimorphilus gyrociliatus]